MPFEKRKGTQIIIKVRRDEAYNLFIFLSKYTGFNHTDSYTSDLPNDPNYVRYVAFFNVHYNFRERRDIQKVTKKMGGHVVDITLLGKEPMPSKETRDMLINSALLAVVSFLPGVIGVPLVSPGKVLKGLIIGGVTALLAFFVELYIQRRIRQH